VTKQYDVCANTDRVSRERFPYFVVMQSDLLQPMETVIVAPVASEKASSSIDRLHPRIEIKDKKFRAVVSALAAIPRDKLGKVVGNVSKQHAEFISAIDLLFSGY
jgi:toxin CcdB